MGITALILSVASLAGLLVAGLLLRGFLPSYVAEKGKNAASKEDLSHITELVESIKALHTSEIERLKAGLLAESQVTERRRHVYEEMCASLRVFVAGHSGTPEAKERFHSAHAAAWLWASDAVLKALNHFIDLQVQHAVSPCSIGQSRIKSAYAAVVLAMRRDVGFPETTVVGSDYQFVQF
jgi:uncharacterized small protein (DUF1192 family)